MKPKHAGGRPPKYCPEILVKFRQYNEQAIDTKDEDGKIEVNLPSIPGLAVFLGISKETVYDWARKFEEFSELLGKMLARQEARLLNNGLGGKYNSNLAKFILSARHDYREKTDVTTDDKAISINIDI